MTSSAEISERHRAKVQFRDAVQKIILFIFVALPIVALVLATVFGALLALAEVRCA